MATLVVLSSLAGAVVDAVAGAGAGALVGFAVGSAVGCGVAGGSDTTPSVTYFSYAATLRLESQTSWVISLWIMANVSPV